MQLSTIARRSVATVFLLALIVLGIYAIRWQPSIDDAIRPVPVAPGPGDAGAEAISVRLYFADGDAQCLLAESRELTLRGADVEGTDGRQDGVGLEAAIDPERVALAALAELAAGPQHPDLWPTIPPGARVLSLAFRDGLAIVDYSGELRINHGGGSAGELLTVGSIAATLSEFPEVEAVQILLEGHVMETLVGHLSLVDPVSIDHDALRQGTICWDGIH